jgi:hypothetical protein
MVMKLDPTTDLIRMTKIRKSGRNVSVLGSARLWFMQSGWYICGCLCGYDVRKEVWLLRDIAFVCVARLEEWLGLAWLLLRKCLGDGTLRGMYYE